VTIRPDDLRGEAADAYRVWRNTFGLSESAALAAVQQDGLVQLSEHDQLARTFREVFDMSESAARVAADGRGGPSVRPVSQVAGRSSAGPQPGDALQMIGKIEELAADLCRRGVSEERALQEAAFAVFQGAPDDQTQEWVAQVTGRRWPGLWRHSGSTSGGKDSSSGQTSGNVRG
jgi:hypothetical protein